MKIRTIYFKVSQMETAVSFWSAFLQIVPHKNSDEWVEFRCGDVNFALLKMSGCTLAKDLGNCVPVFEYAYDELEEAKASALLLGATIVIDIADHPDGISYVLVDPLGNEFEITRMHG